MKKLLLLLLITISLVSCTAPELTQDVKQSKAIANTTNKFTVVWSSNQVEPYVEFTKHIFKDCKIVSSETSIHTENRFNIELKNGQTFDINIKRKATAIRPELYIAIYKGDVLQYEKEVDTHGYMMANFCDYQGNIGCEPLNK